MHLSSHWYLCLFVTSFIIISNAYISFYKFYYPLKNIGVIFSQLSSLTALQDWVSRTDIQNFGSCYALETKWTCFHAIQFMQNTEDNCRNLRTLLLILIQSSLIIESQNLKELVYWEMRNNHERSEGDVWDGVLSILSSSLRLVLPMGNKIVFNIVINITML